MTAAPRTDWTREEIADLFALRLRPNPNRVTLGFTPICAKVRERWPEVTIVAD